MFKLRGAQYIMLFLVSNLAFLEKSGLFRKKAAKIPERLLGPF
jgi:hypothetical protein